MIKITKFFLILSITCLLLTTSSFAGAQEEQEDQTPNLISAQDVTVEATAEVNLDEQVSPQDLEIKDPKLLPDSPFYFLKEWGRKIRLTFTFNKVKKAVLENKYSNEKLIELKKLVEKNASPEIIKKATEKYQQKIEDIKNIADKIKENAASNPEINKFLEKFINQQVLHQQILEKLQSQVPAEVFQKIKDAREAHLEKFGQVMQKLEDRADKIKDNLEKVCITFWDPVCGKDGKTYSNSCFAKLAGVEVASKDACPTTCQLDTDCPQPNCGTKANCIGVQNKCTEGECITTRNLITSQKEQRCLNTGGKISTITCYCEGVNDFPSNCEVGGCTCNPQSGYSKQIKTCDCGDDKCFNGNKCVPIADSDK